MGITEKKLEKKEETTGLVGLVLASSVILLYILIYLSFAGKALSNREILNER